MSDELPFYAPNKPSAPARQPQPGKHLWTLTRGEQTRPAELRDFGFGAELQVYVNGQFVSGRHYTARARDRRRHRIARDARARRLDRHGISGCELVGSTPTTAGRIDTLT
jgi:hypothetical protein